MAAGKKKKAARKLKTDGKTRKTAKAKKPKKATRPKKATKRKTTAKPKTAKRKKTAKPKKATRRKTAAKRKKATKRKPTPKPKAAAKRKTAAKRKKTAKPKPVAKRVRSRAPKTAVRDGAPGPSSGATARLKTTPTRPRRQPETLRLRSAGPSFTVKDLQKSLAFYRDLLGFTVGDRWERSGELRGVEMVAGRVSLWLSQDDWKKGRGRVKGQGFRVYCRTAQDIDALADRIVAAGGTLAEGPRDQARGGRELALRDPDGFTIMIAREG